MGAKKEPLGPEAGQEMESQGARVSSGHAGTGGASWGNTASVSLFPHLPQPQPGLFLSYLSPSTEAVALAMSSCSFVPCIFPTLHPSPFCTDSITINFK